MILALYNHKSIRIRADNSSGYLGGLLRVLE